MTPQFHKTDLHRPDFIDMKYNASKESQHDIGSESQFATTVNILIQKAENHCSQLIENSRCSQLPFHNWQHTLDVVQNVKEIGAGEMIDNNSMELLIIAAYFHDVGHVIGAEGHERISCRYATDFLEENGIPQDSIDTIKGIILATVMPQNPHTELQKIICDADLAHMGKSSFWIQNERLRKEWSKYCHEVFSDRQWVELNIKFFECHDFKTLYAKNNFGKQKNENSAQLKEQLKD